MVERRYWDSNCFLAYLQEEDGRADRCSDVLLLAERGEIGIVTSVFTLTEVLRLRPRDALPAERRATVEAFFNRPSIRTMMLTRRISEAARDLVWDHGVHPRDSVHVASALAAGVDVLNTFDAALIGNSGRIGSPPLAIEEPAVAEPELDLEGRQD